MKIPRWLKLTGIWTLGGFVVLVSFYALAYAWISYSAKREWAQVKKELEARGEKLSLADFVPPPIPDEQNFFMTPLFWDVAENQTGKNTHRIDALAKSGIFDGVQNSTDERGLMNLAAYADRLRTDGNRNQPATEVILAAYDRHHDLWEEFYQAGEKPEGRFPLQYEKLWSIPIPHITNMMKLAQLLRLHAVACMEAGKTQDAARDVRMIFRISDVISTEPLLISLLVREACLWMTVATIWEGMERHAWSADQLEGFEKQLSSQKLQEGYRLALNGERGLFNVGLAEIATKKRGAWKSLLDLVGLLGLFQNYNTANEDNFFRMGKNRWGWAIIPPGWVYSSMAFYSLEIQKRLDAFRLAEEQGVNQQTIPPDFPRPSPVDYRTWRYLLAGIALPGSDSIAKKTAQIQAQIDMARIACALERYKMANGAYPENLSALVSGYIQKLPNDIADAKPYRYRRNAPDHFTLWSVGFDGVNDDAIPIAKRDAVKGDWVWGVFEYSKKK